MPIQSLMTVAGLVTGETWETPGVLLDAVTYEPLVFGIHPETVSRSKSLIAEDHIIPGRHAPLQEPVAGGAEQLSLDLLFIGSGAIAMAATKQAVHWLESLLFPDTGGGIISAALSAAIQLPTLSDPAPVTVSEMGHPVILSYGAWILERRFRLRNIETITGPGHCPITLLAYRALARLTLQEDEIKNVDYNERRWGLPSL